MIMLSDIEDDGEGDLTTGPYTRIRPERGNLHHRPSVVVWFTAGGRICSEHQTEESEID